MALTAWLSTGATQPVPPLPTGLDAQRVTDNGFPWELMLREQHGLATRAQLLEAGFTDTQIHHRVHSRRWQPILPRVYSVHTGPLRRDATLTAALLYGGAASMLSHRSAAEEWTMLTRKEDAPVHITVPYSRSATGQPATWGLPGVVHPGVVVHRSRAFAHIVVVTDPPRTARADTAVDLAVAEPSAGEAARTLVAAATAGGVQLSELRRRVEQRRPSRYGAAIAGALDLMATGVQSALEHRYAVDVERLHGLPPARRQEPLIVDGRTLWEDCDYSETGVPLIVRLDGRRFHDAPEVAFRDRRRDNAAELANRPRLVYGWSEVTRDACGVAAEVWTVLLREGWSTGRLMCPRCPSDP